MSQLTVLTMNCLGLPVPLPGLRRRLAALGKAIAETDADVACLQEVGRWRHLPLLRHDDTRWPQAIAMSHPYAPKGGLVTLARPQVNGTSYQMFRERGRAISIHATERYQQKGVLNCVLRIADQSVVVLNTHLAANYTARWSYTNPYAKVERAQLRELAELVQAIPRETLVIIAGDFNVPRGSWLYDEFRTTTGVIDPLADSPEPTYRPLPGVSARAVQALDHLLVRVPPHWSITAEAALCFRDPVLLAHGITGYLSDHLGVRLQLAWSPHSHADSNILTQAVAHRAEL